MSNKSTAEILGDKASFYLDHQCKTISKEQLHLPSQQHLDQVWTVSNRSNQVLKSMQSILNQGRLGSSGYVSILPVDQGIEHSAGASFAQIPCILIRKISLSWPLRGLQCRCIHLWSSGIRFQKIRT